MQVESIAEWSILQYSRPSLSYQLSLRSLLCLSSSGRFYTGFTVFKQYEILSTKLPQEHSDQECACTHGLSCANTCNVCFYI